MSDWKTIRAALVALSVWVAVSGSSTFAQNDPEADVARARAAAQAEAARQAAARDAENARLDRERANKSMQDFLRDSRIVIASANADADRRQEMLRQIEKNQLRDAFQSFQAGREEFAEALSFKAKLRNPTRKIEKSSGVFIDFIKRHTKERADFDASEFKDFTATELKWETLTTAERLAPSLAVMIEGLNASSVDIRFLQALPKLEAELLRLQWMTKKVK